MKTSVFTLLAFWFPLLQVRVVEVIGVAVPAEVKHVCVVCGCVDVRKCVCVHLCVCVYVRVCVCMCLCMCPQAWWIDRVQNIYVIVPSMLSVCIISEPPALWRAQPIEFGMILVCLMTLWLRHETSHKLRGFQGFVDLLCDFRAVPQMSSEWAHFSTEFAS
jgi:hypothetical protein